MVLDRSEMRPWAAPFSAAAALWGALRARSRCPAPGLSSRRGECRCRESSQANICYALPCSLSVWSPDYCRNAVVGLCWHCHARNYWSELAGDNSPYAHKALCRGRAIFGEAGRRGRTTQAAQPYNIIIAGSTAYRSIWRLFAHRFSPGTRHVRRPLFVAR